MQRKVSNRKRRSKKREKRRSTKAKKQSVVKRRSRVKRRSKQKRSKSKKTIKRYKISLQKFAKSRVSNVYKKSVRNKKLRHSLKKRLHRSLRELSMTGGNGQGVIPKRVSKKPTPIMIPLVQVISNRLQKIELLKSPRMHRRTRR